MASFKKRKVDTGGRVFQEKWTYDVFFVLCLICKKSVAVMKECNMKRHFSSKILSMTVFKANWEIIK
jgi:hypothetical protein